ncbi:MAG TPA: CoA pyrophosphatase [Acidobacteriota bacterium]|nr:CoA pyrophosphatase [Acidobacteriota bacterium]
MKHLESRIRDLLSASPRRVEEKPAVGEAAVLVSILNGASGPQFLLTRRTDDVPTHKGQISFPGGIRKSGDRSLQSTALRETEEEIGVDRNRIRVLGAFHDFVAISGHRVTPFVGVLPGDDPLRPQAEEVAYLLKIPVEFFQNTRPEIRILNRFGADVEVCYYHYGEETVWGLTARIIHDLLQELKLEK